MDIVVLVSLLSPCLPFLMKLGDKAAESAASKIGADAWETAKKIWDVLHPHVDQKPDVLSAVSAVADSPEDEDCQEFLQKKLQRLLKDQPELVEQISQILQASPIAAPTTQISQTISQNSGQAIGQMTNGNAIGQISGSVQGGIHF